METQREQRREPDWDDEDDMLKDAIAHRRRPTYLDEDSFERGAALDGLKLEVRSQNFRSGRVTAVLAGVTVDLRNAGLSPEGATIDVQSALSGIDILVPRGWDVVCDVGAVCGGIDGERFPPRSDHARPRLRVTGMVVAGGLSVR